MKNRILFVLGVLAVCSCSNAVAGPMDRVPAATVSDEKLLDVVNDSQRILFLGDSITFGGKYVAYFDTWLWTQSENPPLIINAGLPSETVSGLSEEGHAGGRFPRPDLAERLQRALDTTKPDLVFACYGINCGIYQPFDFERFGRYQQGVMALRKAVESRDAQLVMITPPVYDDLRAKKKQSFSYNAVLDRYSEWLLSLRDDGLLVVDLHGPMTRELAKRRESEPDFTFQPDAVHPNAAGHWFMAQQLIRACVVGQAEVAESPAAMLANAGADAKALGLIEQRMQLLRNAYLSAAGHKRPGIAPGLALPEAHRGAAELTAGLKTLAAENR